MVTDKRITEGSVAPMFSLSDAEGKSVSLSAFKGKWVVIYFYPKDDTPGCTVEARDFTSDSAKFSKLGVEVIGISGDSAESHGKFSKKYGLKVRLLSDGEKKVMSSYGVWKKKRMWGREYLGVQRSTFIIDPQGIVRKAWYGVKAEGHAKDVLEEIKKLNNGGHDD